MTGRFAPLAVLAVAWVWLAATSARTVWWSYDEGVYATAAARWAAGETPYADFFAPQPPGILAVGAVSEAAGLGIAGTRVFAFACGLGLLAGTYRLGRVVAERAGAPDPTGVGFVAAAFAGVEFEVVYACGEAATVAPAACLTVLAIGTLFGRWTWRHLAAGLGVGLATVFRLQPASLAPAAAAAIICLDGWRAGIKGVCWFGAGLAVGLAAAHGPPAACWPGYGWCVVGFQATQPRYQWVDREPIVWVFATQAPVIVGLAATVGGLIDHRPAVRAVAWAGLLALAVTVVVGAGLQPPYFMFVHPFVAVAGALAVAEWWTRFTGRPNGFGFVAAGLAALGCIATTVFLLRQNAGVADQGALLTELRASPAEVWLCMDCRRPAAAGKRSTGGWIDTDPMALTRDTTAFQRWATDGVAAADGVVVTELLTELVTPDTARRILNSGKPVLYETPAARVRLTARAGER